MRGGRGVLKTEQKNKLNNKKMKKIMKYVLIVLIILGVIYATYFFISSNNTSAIVYKTEVAKKMAERFFHGEGENSFFLWQWINLEMWLREFID